MCLSSLSDSKINSWPYPYLLLHELGKENAFSEVIVFFYMTHRMGCHLIFFYIVVVKHCGQGKMLFKSIYFVPDNFRRLESMAIMVVSRQTGMILEQQHTS